MKAFLGMILILSGMTVAAWGQDPQGEIRLYYQTIQGFDFDSGSPGFRIAEEDFHGGGFGFVYYLNGWFGIFSNSSFFSGVEENQIDLKLINQTQGVKLTARELGPINLFAKGGIGFARFVFSSPQFQETVRYGTSFIGGGGLEVGLSEGLLLFVEASQTSMSLPDITGSPERDKWDSNLGLTTGVSLQF